MANERQDFDSSNIVQVSVQSAEIESTGELTGGLRDAIEKCLKSFADVFVPSQVD